MCDICNESIMKDDMMKCDHQYGCLQYFVCPVCADRINAKYCKRCILDMIKKCIGKYVQNNDEIIMFIADYLP